MDERARDILRRAGYEVSEPISIGEDPIVREIKGVVDRHDFVKAAWIFGNYASRLLGYPSYKTFRPESDIDVMVMCEPDWCPDDKMAVLERELPSIMGHPVSWDTSAFEFVSITKPKVMIKPYVEVQA